MSRGYAEHLCHDRGFAVNSCYDKSLALVHYSCSDMQSCFLMNFEAHSCFGMRSVVHSCSDTRFAGSPCSGRGPVGHLYSAQKKSYRTEEYYSAQQSNAQKIHGCQPETQSLLNEVLAP